MARVVKCDICGQIDGYEGAKTMYIRRIYPDGRDTTPVTSGRGTVKGLDLCHDCVNAIEKALETRRMENG